MKYFIFVFYLCFFTTNVSGQTSTLLPNGWTITPAGTKITLGDLPLNMVISPNNKYIAVTNNGWGKQSIQLIDAKSFTILDTAEIAQSWLGLKFSNDNKYLYASAGNCNQIIKYTITNNHLVIVDSIVLGKKWPEKVSPTGIEINDKRQQIYVVSKESNSLYIIDIKTNVIIKQIQLSAEAFTCLLSPNGKYLYITVWGGAKVFIYNTEKELITDSINVGKNPNDLCISKNGKWLYVANSVDNTVSVIETATNKVIETLNTALFPNAPSGSTTNSVALSADNNKLYVANADNNYLAVFNVSKPGASTSLGFIPTGWYPTCVRVFKDKLLVLNGKGAVSKPNPKGPQPIEKNGQSNYKKGNKKSEQYIGGLFIGSMSIINVPNEKELVHYTEKVYKNTPYTKEKETKSEGETGNPIPKELGQTSPIKNVFYVIKENRTYDQVLGDEPEGNGDTSLVLFGKKITPNEHAIAEQFVLLDNFYVDAEVSADGHNWSMAAYANDYVEKTWPSNYSGRGGTYDYAANKKVAMPKNGFLWDYALRAGISFRDYGEFTDDDGTVYLLDLQKHMCKDYPGWNLMIRDTEREKIWEKDFDSLVAINKVPQLNILYLPNDHTAGLSKKTRTPYAYVAENDLALGLFLEHLSQSTIWKDCAVFVLEDDAQNGPDNVDAHRSIAFLAGPYIKRKFIDHSMYSTSGMLRTMELILGLPPMSQYDAAATPMYKCFIPQMDTKTYIHLPEEINIDEMNTAYNFNSKISDEFDLSGPDRIPDLILNKVIWSAIKKNVPFPAPVRAAFLKTNTKDIDD